MGTETEGLIERAEHDARVKRLARHRHPPWRLFRANLRDFGMLVRDARWSLIGFVLVMACGTVYLAYRYDDYDHSRVDRFTIVTALYESLRMLVFQSPLPLPEHDALGVAFFFVLPLLGLALVFQSILNFGRHVLDKGSRREAWQAALASTLRGHVIVAGLGRLGYRVLLEVLDAGHEAVVVEKDPAGEFVAKAIRLRVPVIAGDGREASVLEHAGIRRARGLFASIDDDLLNTEIALAAKEVRPDLKVVLRIFNEALDSNLDRAFGASTGFSSSALAAPTLAARAFAGNAYCAIPFPDGLVVMAEARATRESPLLGPSDRVESACRVQVIAHMDALGRMTAPCREAEIRENDSVLVLGTLEAVAALDGGRPGRPAQADGPVIVCGVGHVGYRVVRALHSIAPSCGIVVVCRDEDTDRRFLEEFADLKIRVVFGDARRHDVLLAAGAPSARSVVAATSDDLVNLQIGLAARRAREDLTVVVRVFSDVLAERLESIFGANTAFSAAALAAPTLAAATLIGHVEHAVDIGDRLFAAVARRVDPGEALEGRTLAEVREGSGALVLALRREGAPFVALEPATRLVRGDDVVILAEIETLTKRGSALRATRTRSRAPRL